MKSVLETYLDQFAVNNLRHLEIVREISHELNPYEAQVLLGMVYPALATLQQAYSYAFNVIGSKK